MADVPQRIWAALYAHTVAAELTPDPLSGDGKPYILATPEALASQPEVQALIRAAKAEGMREAAGIIERAKVEDQEAGITWGADPYVCDLFGHHIRAAAASAERG